MPADYTSTAQALSLPISSPESSPTSPNHPSDTPLPPWAGRGRAGSGGRLHNMRRLSTPYSRGSDSDHRPFGQRIMQSSVSILNKLVKLGNSMTPVQQILAGIAGIVLLALSILFLVFSHRIFSALRPVAENWRKLPGGWVILFLLCSITAFPPLIGYSTTVTIAGFVYGFPGGWPIVASATVAGSAGAFIASRTVLSGYVDRLVGSDRRFVALGEVLRHDGLPVLTAIRFCPLPYSLSNGFLATIPSITPARFALATAMATPKLLVHVFIGSRLATLGDDMSAGDRFVNYASIALSAVIGLVVGLVIYRRTMRRAAELAIEERAENGDLPDPADYEDLEEGILGDHGENDAVAFMDDDDISLWDTAEGPTGTYRDGDDMDTTSPGK
ncbi:hypothetical protein F5Y18DRAFT_137151 [Xylariaceae sp. FL1019]|nr:hypothetical protein F5Y18DRAFT_137151 [Xylariaceae sp. FL1019]